MKLTTLHEKAKIQVRVALLCLLSAHEKDVGRKDLVLLSEIYLKER
jgi:hypothetical protein